MPKQGAPPHGGALFFLRRRVGAAGSTHPPEPVPLPALATGEQSGMTQHPTEAQGDPAPERVEQARRHVRRFRRGVVRAGEAICPSAFVIDNRDGSVVMPAEPDFWAIDQLVLYIPDDGFAEMALLLNAEPFEAAFDEALDRHQAYHGRAGSTEWAKARLDSAKWGGDMFPGGALLDANPLRAVEPALCKRLNQDKNALAEVSELLTRVRPETPVCVGVDHLGMDVRTSVGVIRVEWPREIEGPESAPKVIEALLTGALE